MLMWFFVLQTESATLAPLSPILSQPKVIRFPVLSRASSSDKSQAEAETIRCCWKDCNVEFICGSKLLEHLQVRPIKYYGPRILDSYRRKIEEPKNLAKRNNFGNFNWCFYFIFRASMWTTRRTVSRLSACGLAAKFTTRRHAPGRG